jgi:hypothetical protein
MTETPHNPYQFKDTDIPVMYLKSTAVVSTDDSYLVPNVGAQASSMYGRVPLFSKASPKPIVVSNDTYFQDFPLQSEDPEGGRSFEEWRAQTLAVCKRLMRLEYALRLTGAVIGTLPPLPSIAFFDPGLFKGNWDFATTYLVGEVVRFPSTEGDTPGDSYESFSDDNIGRQPNKDKFSWKYVGIY